MADVTLPTSPKILMFPWLAFGHISPFLELSKKLCDRGFYIYLCSTPINLNSIKNKINQNYSLSIQLLDLHLPNLPQLPPSLHTTNGLPSHLNSTLHEALYESKPEICQILNTIKPGILIYDVLLPWTAALASKYNIPAVCFSTSNSVCISYTIHRYIKPGIAFPFQAIYLSDFEKARNEKRLQSTKNQASSRDPKFQESMFFFNNILIIRSSREIEGKYSDYLSELLNSKVFLVSPVIHQEQGIKDKDKEEEELIQWLGKKSEKSSVFVSFGSEYFLNKQEIEEIAIGLEISNVNFIWVLRFPKGEEENTKIEEVLPEGFLERVKERGKIVKKWAPQTEILRHPSIGGFVSHCGWNSVMESIEIGVPIIAMPMHLEQPFNARLVVEIGVGIEVKRDYENGKFGREDIAECIKDVVLGGKGEILEGKVRDLSEKLKDREEKDFDELVGMLKGLCHCSHKLQ